MRYELTDDEWAAADAAEQAARRAMIDTVTIRAALPSDAYALHVYLTAIVGERLPVLFVREQPPTPEQVATMIARLADDERSCLLLALDGAAVIGMLDFSSLARAQQRHVGSFGMSVARAARGRGIGTHLLRSLYGYAKEHGFRRIELEVFATNTAAIRLYEREGFEHEGRRRGAVMVGEEAVDIVMMGKWI